MLPALNIKIRSINPYAHNHMNDSFNKSINNLGKFHLNIKQKRNFVLQSSLTLKNPLQISSRHGNENNILISNGYNYQNIDKVNYSNQNELNTERTPFENQRQSMKENTKVFPNYDNIPFIKLPLISSKIKIKTPVKEENFNQNKAIIHHNNILLTFLTTQIDLNFLFQENGKDDNNDNDNNNIDENKGVFIAGYKRIIKNFFRAIQSNGFDFEKSSEVIYLLNHFIKAEMCFCAAVLVSLNMFNRGEFISLIKAHFKKISYFISSALFNIYETFFPEEEQSKLNEKYEEKYNEQIKQYQLFYKTLEKDEIIKRIYKEIDKSIHSIKYFALKNSKYISPFSKVLAQLLTFPEKRSCSFFIKTIIDTALFNLIKFNKSYHYSITSCSFKDTVINNEVYQSKLTLILDLDETLIHSFINNSNRMFLLRPHCLEFLNDIKDYYDIIIFTAGTKEVK